MDKTDVDWMKYAMTLAQKAEAIGEIPVGAVIVCNNEVIGEGYNMSITQHDPSAHAEMIAVRQAGAALQNYRLPGCTLYVTLEPCPMCAGLLVHSRIERLVFAASDLKTGAAGSVMNLIEHSQLNHQIECEKGVCGDECSTMLSNFFKRRRAEIKEQKRLAKLENTKKIDDL